jgi:hypothetical protein
MLLTKRSKLLSVARRVLTTAERVVDLRACVKKPEVYRVKRDRFVDGRKSLGQLSQVFERSSTQGVSLRLQFAGRKRGMPLRIVSSHVRTGRVALRAA